MAEVVMKKQIAVTVVVAFLGSPCGLWAEDVPSLEPGVTVRLTGGDDEAIPRVGEVVVDDHWMVAVRVPGQEEPAAVLRPGRPMVGDVVAVDDETISIRPDGQHLTFRVSRSTLARIEVPRGASRGKRFGNGAFLGAVGGALIGGVIGYRTYHSDLCYADWESGRMEPCSSRAAETLGAGFEGAAVGALVGGLAGLASFQERWQPLEPKAEKGVSLGLLPVHAGVGLSLRYGF
jgi:hypothetical protein